MEEENDKASMEESLVGREPNALLLWLITIGMLLVAAGTVLPLFTRMLNLDHNTFKYVYATGAVFVLVGRIFTINKGNETRLKRLYRIETWSAIFFCVAVFFMFYKGAGPRDWLAFTLAGGVIQVYTAIMIPRTFAKVRQEKQGANIK